MIYRKEVCPHCGNEIVVKSVKELQKCCWCRRLYKAKFFTKGKKIYCEVEPVEFEAEYANRGDYYVCKGYYY